MLATIDADDGFDLASGASPGAPALILAGTARPFLLPALFEEPQR